MLPLAIVSLLLLVLSVVLLSGHGDRLIAGYNTLSAKEREGVHIHRLRWVLAVTLVLDAAVLWLPWILHQEEEVMAILASVLYLFIISAVAVVLANTWCKR